MQKKIKFMEAEFPDIEMLQKDSCKLRGFFADQNREDEFLHNHTPDGKRVIYRYPLVQYKKYRGHPFILAFGEAIPSLHTAVMEADELVIGDKKWPAGNLNIRLCEKTVGDGVPMTKYCFISPWVCLNQENYKHYQKLNEEGKNELLKKILIGNILSLCGGFGVTVEQHLKVQLNVHEKSVLYKGVSMIAFVGSFEVNCALPSLCGLGKGVARGMGTFIRKSQEQVS